VPSNQPAGQVIYKILVNGKTVTDLPLDVELRQEFGAHDTFSLRIEYNRARDDIQRLPLWPDDAPVQITWGRGPSDLSTWYGYVNHHTVDGNSSSGSQTLQITYTCIGTSKPMNSDKSRNWGQVTCTYLAKKIAQEHGLRAVLTKTNWILPFEIQANESDFTFLNRIASKVGFRFWVSGGTLYFIDPAVVLTSSSKVAVPEYRMDKMPGQLDTIRQFNSRQGGNIPGATLSNRQIYGLDWQSGSVIQVGAQTNNSNLFTQINSQQYVSDITDAQNRMNAWQSLSQFFIPATAELYGNTLLYPGKLVLLQGRQMPSGTQGYWLVSSVTHMLRSSYTSIGSEDRNISRVDILRNSTGSIPSIKEYNKINPEFVTCKLMNNRWISTNNSVIYDGVWTV
jgi:phage protein D